MGAYREVVVRGSLRGLDDGYAVDIQPSVDVPIPLAAVASVRVAIDGTWAATAGTSIAISNDECPVDGLASQDSVWPAHRSASVHVRGVPRPVPGTDHHIAVEISYRIPPAGGPSADRWVTIETAA